MIFLLFIESNFYLILLFTESKITHFLITLHKSHHFLPNYLIFTLSATLL